MPFEDKQLSCLSCERTFIFSAGEQEFYAAKKLENEPKRCPKCRMVQKLQKEGKDPGYSTEVHCGICGTLAVVPFRPLGVRPVLCSACHQKQKSEQSEK